MDYTAIITKTKSGRYIAQCKELPAALTQGDTEEEALENLQDAIDLILETEKEEKVKVSKRNKFKIKVIYNNTTSSILLFSATGCPKSSSGGSTHRIQ